VKKIFLSVIVLFIFSTLFLNFNQKVQAATTNIDGKCVSCPSISQLESHTVSFGRNPPPDADALNLTNPGYGWIYCNGDFRKVTDEIQNPSDCQFDYTKDYYCIYTKDSDSTYKFVISDAKSVSNECSGSTPVCSADGDGCIGEDIPQQTECRFVAENTPCGSQSFCKDGGNPDCADYYCVDKNTKTLADYNDSEDNLRCMSFPDGEPECGEPGPEDDEMCEDPFNNDPDPVCIPDDPETVAIEGNAREKCFSGICKEDGTCDDTLVAMACEQRAGGISCRTALGTFTADTQNFTQSVLRLLLGLSGGILLILIIFNGYKLMASQGDPERIKDAREGIIAAIAGILLIIFSLSILQFITVDIIGIPGFGK
jgi:hypothetical protein